MTPALHPAAVVWPLTVLAALVLQSTVIEGVAVLGVKPDLVLLVTVFAALTRGPVAAMLLGFGTGLAQDALSGAVLGSGAWSKALCGTVVGVLRGSFFREHLATHLAIAFLATWVAESGFYLLALAFGLAETGLSRLVLLAGVGGAYNAALAPSTFWLLSRLLPPPRGGGV